MKKKPLLAMALLASVTALASCGGGETSDGPVKAGHLNMTVAHSTIPEGTNFYDGCKPTVTDTDTNQDITNYYNQLVFTINPIVDGSVDTKVSYGAGDALDAGTYRVNLQARNSVVELDITVKPSEAETASEGNGYTTVYGGEGTDFDRLALYQPDSTLGTLGAGNFPSVGSPKMIVIPVYFKDVATFTDTEKDIIERAYFGTDSSDKSDPNHTSWESLHSYYLRSSYGKLDIEGMVTDPFQYQKTQDQAENGTAADILTAAWQWFKTAYPNEDPKDYDYNGDGYIDSINLIYKSTKGLSGSDQTGLVDDLWWNYTSNVSGAANVNSPVPHRYFFASLEMLRTSYYVDDPVVDAHVLVHEHGHAMGLADYYSYATDASGTKVDGAPAGCADMMDMNVGDHNAYSKMRLGWIKENAEDEGLDIKWVDGSSDDFDITIDSFEEEGDVIVVRNTTTDPWNKTPYDEYLIITYYTPTGVNEQDSTGYGEWLAANDSTGQASNGNGGPYRYPGVQIFHVDARVAADTGTYSTDLFGNTQYESDGYAYTDDIFTKTTLDEENGTYVGAAQFITSNTLTNAGSDSAGRASLKVEDGKLVEGGDAELRAVLSSGVDSFSSTSYYNSMGIMPNLFGTKKYAESKEFTSTEQYGGDTYSNYKARNFFQNQEALLWNDDSYFNWTISVVAQDDDTATLHFVNNESL